MRVQCLSADDGARLRRAEHPQGAGLRASGKCGEPCARVRSLALLRVALSVLRRLGYSANPLRLFLPVLTMPSLSAAYPPAYPTVQPERWRRVLQIDRAVPVMSSTMWSLHAG